MHDHPLNAAVSQRHATAAQQSQYPADVPNAAVTADWIISALGALNDRLAALSSSLDGMASMLGMPYIPRAALGSPVTPPGGEPAHGPGNWGDAVNDRLRQLTTLTEDLEETTKRLRLFI